MRRIKRSATTTTVRVADGAQICVEAIGDRGAPAIVLIAGAAWSMDWWDDELCRRLSDRGRLVVRYDNRDTGRSTSYPPGAPAIPGRTWSPTQSRCSTRWGSTARTSSACRWAVASPSTWRSTTATA